MNLWIKVTHKHVVVICSEMKRAQFFTTSVLIFMYLGCEQENTVNTWNISRMFIVLWAITGQAQDQDTQTGHKTTN